MAHIMLTKACNLNCKYCFANEFVNKARDFISVQNFKTAVDFITKTSDTLGLIGGEPTIHPQFNELLQLLIDNPRVKHVTIFTNGLELHKSFKYLSNPKFSALVNLNSPEDIGETRFNKVMDNIGNHSSPDKVNLGINLYKPDLDYSYIINACKQFHKHTLRISICVPNLSEQRNCHSLEWFKVMKPLLVHFLNDTFSNGIVPSYDCNLVPKCIFTDKEFDWLSKASQLAREKGLPTNLADGLVGCDPVIDILPDLSVVRCFGMSTDLKLNISDFNNLEEIAHEFAFKLDTFKYLISANPECSTCKEASNHRCTGGCLAYKSKKLQHMYDISTQLNNQD